MQQRRALEHEHLDAGALEAGEELLQVGKAFQVQRGVPAIGGGQLFARRGLDSIEKLSLLQVAVQHADQAFAARVVDEVVCCGPRQPAA